MPTRLGIALSLLVSLAIAAGCRGEPECDSSHPCAVGRCQAGTCVAWDVSDAGDAFDVSSTADVEDAGDIADVGSLEDAWDAPDAVDAPDTSNGSQLLCSVTFSLPDYVDADRYVVEFYDLEREDWPDPDLELSVRYDEATSRALPPGRYPYRFRVFRPKNDSDVDDEYDEEYDTEVLVAHPEYINARYMGYPNRSAGSDMYYEARVRDCSHPTLEYVPSPDMVAGARRNTFAFQYTPGRRSDGQAPLALDEDSLSIRLCAARFEEHKDGADERPCVVLAPDSEEDTDSAEDGERDGRKIELEVEENGGDVDITVDLRALEPENLGSPLPYYALTPGRYTLEISARDEGRAQTMPPGCEKPEDAQGAPRATPTRVTFWRRGPDADWAWPADDEQNPFDWAGALGYHVTPELLGRGTKCCPEQLQRKGLCAEVDCDGARRGPEVRAAVHGCGTYDTVRGALEDESHPLHQTLPQFLVLPALVTRRIDEGPTDNRNLTDVVCQDKDATGNALGVSAYFTGSWNNDTRGVDPEMGDPELWGEVGDAVRGEKALVELVAAAHRRGIRVVASLQLNSVHANDVGSPISTGWRRTNTVECGTKTCGWEVEDDCQLDCRLRDYLNDISWTNQNAEDYLLESALWWLTRFELDGLVLQDGRHLEPNAFRNLTSRIEDELESGDGQFPVFADVGIHWTSPVPSEDRCGPELTPPTSVYDQLIKRASYGVDGLFDRTLRTAVVDHCNAFGDQVEGSGPHLAHARWWAASVWDAITPGRAEALDGDAGKSAASVPTAAPDLNLWFRFLTAPNDHRLDKELRRGGEDEYGNPLYDRLPDEAERAERATLAHIWLMTLPGMPVLHADDEPAGAGEALKRLARARREHAELRTGALVLDRHEDGEPESNDVTTTYSRCLPDGPCAHVLLNASAEEATRQMNTHGDAGASWADVLLGGCDVESAKTTADADGVITLLAAAGEGAVYVRCD